MGEVLHTVYTLYMGHTWVAFDPSLVSSCEAHVLSSWVIYVMFCKCELVWASWYGGSLTPREERCEEKESCSRARLKIFKQVALNVSQSAIK